MSYVCGVEMGGIFRYLLVGGSLLSNSKFLGHSETALRLCMYNRKRFSETVGAIQRTHRYSVAGLQNE